MQIQIREVFDGLFHPEVDYSDEVHSCSPNASKEWRNGDAFLLPSDQIWDSVRCGEDNVSFFAEVVAKDRFKTVHFFRCNNRRMVG